MINLIMGIDPGMSGGVALLSFNGEEPEATAFSKCTEKDICTIIKTCAFKVSKCYIESVHAMPKQGVSSTFKFGRNFGLLIGALYTSDVPFEFVTPQRWQKFLGCMSHGDKNVTKTKAQQLFPKLKITHAIADALLIAEFGRCNTPTASDYDL